MLNRLRHARNVKQQISIEAQLNLIPADAVRRIAAEHGIELVPKPVTKVTQPAKHYDYTEAAELHTQGYCDNEIAWMTGIPVRSICYWRKTRGLRPNPPTRKEAV